MPTKKVSRFSNELRKSLTEKPGADSATEADREGWDPYEVWRTRVKDPQEYRLSLKGTSKNQDFFVRARKPRAENRSLHASK